MSGIKSFYTPDGSLVQHLVSLDNDRIPGDIVKQHGSVSSAIRFELVETDHDFKLIDGQQDRIVALTREFVGLGTSV